MAGRTGPLGTVRGKKGLITTVGPRLWEGLGCYMIRGYCLNYGDLFLGKHGRKDFGVKKQREELYC